MHRFAVAVITGHDAAFSPLTTPSVAYTCPEAAPVGVTEKEPQERNIDDKKGNFSWGRVGTKALTGAELGAGKAPFEWHL